MQLLCNKHIVMLYGITCFLNHIVNNEWFRKQKQLADCLFLQCKV